MLMSSCVRRGTAVALACLALLAAACDSGGSGSSDSEVDAGRANVDAMSREHADDTPVANAASQAAPRRAVISERLPYADVDDELVYGYFAFPTDMVEPLPAVIMIHEWWGLNDNIRSMTERLAGEGYIVLAVDLFGGKIATSPEEARVHMLAVVENPEPATENIRQAYEFVSSTAGAPRIGSLGWCFGGGWSLNTAILFPDDLDATVIYYGQVTNDEEKLSAINAPILGLFGAEDKGITVNSVRRFETALERLRKDYEIHIYPGADHAFANPSGTAYNARAAEDAWQKTLDFLARHLAAESAEDP